MNINETKNNSTPKTPWFFAIVIIANLGVSGYLLMKQRKVDIESSKATQLESDNKVKNQLLIESEVKLNSNRKQDQDLALKVALLKSDIDSLEKEKNAINDIISKKSDLENHDKTIKIKIESGEIYLEDISRKITEEKKSLNLLGLNVEKSSESLIALRQDMDKISTQVEDLKIKKTKHEEEIKKLSDEIEKKDLVYQTVNAAEAKVSSLKTQEDRLVGESQNLKGSIEQLKTQKLSIENEIGSLSESLRQLQSAQAATETLKSSSKKIKDDIASLDKLIIDKSASLEQLKNRNSELMKEVATREEVLQQMRLEQATVASLKVKKADLTAEITQLKADKSKLKDSK